MVFLYILRGKFSKKGVWIKGVGYFLLGIRSPFLSVPILHVYQAQFLWPQTPRCQAQIGTFSELLKNHLMHHQAQILSVTIPSGSSPDLPITTLLALRLYLPNLSCRRHDKLTPRCPHRLSCWAMLNRKYWDRGSNDLSVEASYVDRAIIVMQELGKVIPSDPFLCKMKSSC